MRRLCVVFLVVFSGVAGQAGTDGTLEGIARDRRTREFLPGITVAILETGRGAATDPHGFFTIPNVRAGTYSVRCSHVGYRTAVIKNVVITADLRTRLVIDLDPTEVQLDEVVVVHEKPLIQRDVTGTTYVISSEELTPLPVTTVFEAIRFRAGVTPEGNVRGGKSTEVLYLVDGLPVQDVVTGGPGVQLPISAVTGMSIYTGGFEADYGNALSGVVNVVTRTGSDTHRALLRAENDNLLGGTQHSRTTTFEVGASGPLLPERLHYAVSLGGIRTGTRWWQDFQHFYDGTTDHSLSGFGKIDYRVTPALRLGAQILHTDHDWKDYEFPWRYNLSGLPPERRRSTRVALILSHAVGETFSYTASLSRYRLLSTIGTGRKEDLPVDDPFQYDFFLRFITSGQRAWWSRTEQWSTTAKLDGAFSINKDHLLKAGGEVTLYDVTSDIKKYEPRKTYFGKPLVNEPQLDFGTSYGYRPVTGAIYVQSKTDVPAQGVLINLGLRYDFLNPTAERPMIEAIPVADSAYRFTVPKTVRASWKQQLSPRFGAAMQIAEHGYLFVNLGWYFQYPLLSYLYSGLDRAALGKGIAALTGNPDLEPERTKMWEISLKYALQQNVVASVAYFRKETTNLVDTKSFVTGDSKLAGGMGFAEYVNNPYADARGLELMLSRDRGEWVTGEVSYTYMVAEGVSGSATDGFYIAQFGLPPAVRVVPLSWDQRHTVKGVLTFSFPWSLSLTGAFEWHTGRPYTAYPTSTGFEKIDGGRFFQNNGRMPDVTNLDLKVEQRFSPRWWPGREIVLTMDCRNLLNASNVVWMDSNGRIGGELNDPSGYFTGRRTSLGIRAEF